MPPRRNQIALYISSPSVTHELRLRHQNIFDTHKDYIELDPRPDHIHFVDSSVEWSMGMNPKDIYAKHRKDYAPEYFYKPIVILDEQTARDGTVLIVSPVLNEDGVFEHCEVRFEPKGAIGAAVNLEISNQDLGQYKEAVDEDGIWRKFPEPQTPA